MDEACEQCHRKYWRRALYLSLLGVILGSVAPDSAALGADAAGTVARAVATGTLKGRVRMSGKVPGNAVIRMGMDPMCALANAGKRPVNEIFVAGGDGGLVNVFVKLDGAFPKTAVPPQPVVLDQSACFYRPRVLGARVG